MTALSLSTQQPSPLRVVGVVLASVTGLPHSGVVVGLMGVVVAVISLLLLLLILLSVPAGGLG